MFHGYLKWNLKTKCWEEDEWLTQIYGKLQEAKKAIADFAGEHPFDNDRELQVTRYFGKSSNPFEHGQELSKGDSRIVMHEWMRYAAYVISD